MFRKGEGRNPFVDKDIMDFIKARTIWDNLQKVNIKYAVSLRMRSQVMKLPTPHYSKKIENRGRWVVFVSLFFTLC